LNWEEGRRSLSSVQCLKRGNKLYNVIFEPLLRGLYSGFSGTIIVEDLFGFTRFVLYRGEELSLLVFPEIEKNGFNREKIISGGEVATADVERVRSDELLEVRKYYPGDDARRINWKMFAASGELFLRIGEEIPPPTGEVTIVLNSHSQGVGSLKFSSVYTDFLIGSYLALVYAFVEKGCVVNVLVPGLKEPFIFDQGKPDKLLSALSPVTSDMKPAQLNDGGFFYIVSHPGSEFLLEYAVNSGKDMKVFIKKLPEMNQKRSMRQLFFKEKESSDSAITESKKILKLRFNAENDLIVLKQSGKGKIHGEII